MRCSQVQRLSTVYLDGDLDPDRSSALRGHLRGCETCAGVLSDEATIRRAATDLDPVLDPPPSVWEGIEARLATEEIADSRRWPVRLLLRRATSAISPYRAHLAVGVALAAVVFALVVKRGNSEVLLPTIVKPELTEIAAPVFAAESSAPETHFEAAMREIRRADDRYLAAIGELRELAADARGDWSTERATGYDAAVSTFEERAAGELDRQSRRLADDPQRRDPLYAIYREYIDYLERSLLEPTASRSPRSGR